MELALVERVRAFIVNDLLFNEMKYQTLNNSVVECVPGWIRFGLADAAGGDGKYTAVDSCERPIFNGNFSRTTMLLRSACVGKMPSFGTNAYRIPEEIVSIFLPFASI